MDEILTQFTSLTNLVREVGLRDDNVMKIKEQLDVMLIPYGVHIYEHHDEYLWADLFIASIEPPIDSL